MNAGIVPSFNPDEVPEDIQQRAADVLRNEIIPTINCDRTLDMTEIAVPMHPVNGIIDLRTTPLDYPNQIYRAVPYTGKQLLEVNATGDMENLIAALTELGLLDDPVTRSEEWPTDQFGEARGVALWSQDFKLIEVKADLSQLHGTNQDTTKKMLNHRYNLPFTPMRVEQVIRASDGAVLQYLHTGEFVSTEFRYTQLVYATEDYPDCLRIRFTPSYGPASTLLIMPVPIRVINSYEEPEPWQGTIVAPNKFRAYLIAKLAFWMAMEYGVSTAEAMKVKENIAYQALLKNPSKRDHPQDISRKIYHLLQRGRGWRAGINGNGYAGGFNG